MALMAAMLLFRLCLASALSLRICTSSLARSTSAVASAIACVSLMVQMTQLSIHIETYMENGIPFMTNSFSPLQYQPSSPPILFEV